MVGCDRRQGIHVCQRLPLAAMSALIYPDKAMTPVNFQSSVLLRGPGQVLPFILRRTKEAVLHDLPPKILQDVYVDPSPLQRRLYEDFGRSPASAQIATAADVKAPHVFQVWFLLRPYPTATISL